MGTDCAPLLADIFLYSYKAQFIQSLPNQPPVSLVKARFVPDTKMLDHIRQGLGKFKLGDTDKTEKVVASHKDRDQFHTSKVQVKKVKQFNTETHSTSITIAGYKNRALIADEYSDKMYLYDNNGKVSKYVTVAKGVGIWDTAVTPTGEIIVTNRDNKIRRVAADGTVAILTDTAPFVPYGVCLMDTRQIGVCMGGQGDRRMLLKLCVVIRPPNPPPHPPSILQKEI